MTRFDLCTLTSLHTRSLPPLRKRPRGTGSSLFSFAVTMLVFAFGLCLSGSRTFFSVSRNVWVPLLDRVESIIADKPSECLSFFSSVDTSESKLGTSRTGEGTCCMDDVTRVKPPRASSLSSQFPESSPMGLMCFGLMVWPVSRPKEGFVRAGTSSGS